MASEDSKSSWSEEEEVKALNLLGFDAKKIDKMQKKIRSALLDTLRESGVSPDGSIGDRTVTKSELVILGQVATKVSVPCQAFRPVLSRWAVDGSFRVREQVPAACAYLESLPKDAELNVEELAAACGVGVDPPDVEATIRAAFDAAIDAIKAQRYAYPLMGIMGNLKRKELRFADSLSVKKEFDRITLEVLGPKTAEDDAAIKAANKSKKKSGKGGKDSAGKGGGKDKGKGGKGGKGSGGSESKSPDPSDGDVVTKKAFAAREISSLKNTEELLKEHADITGGRIRTRFPPEPNGYLHIGHAKSMNLNFDGAFRALGVPHGDTFFRYDDTNPESESMEYINAQADNVKWLGWKPFKVTHSSDYFPQLYDLAVELIKRGKAYVCHQTSEEMEACRELRREMSGDPHSPWRDRSVEENLLEFERMRDGCYAAGAAVLRMKIDWKSDNPCMWDPIAYRIKYMAHPHAGDKWCIYPSYDYTHCLVDSLEHIDYSLCTLEFEPRRDSYYWLLEALDLWRPYVYEFSKLMINGSMLSKRRFLKLIGDGIVRGWDDPRLYTIMGMQRRGFTPDGINAFCRDVGVTRNRGYIPAARLEYWIRNDLNIICKRGFAVVDPLPITLTNVDDDFEQTFEAADYPHKPEVADKHDVSLTKRVYVERSDFREVNSKDFYGLAPDKWVGLRYAGLVRVTNVIKEGDKVVALEAEYKGERTIKVKGNIHWVSGKKPAKAEFRIYEQLFTTDKVGSTGDWYSELNPESESVSYGFIDSSLEKAAVGERFQFERVGYFIKDKDSTDDTHVFNRTLPLRESNKTGPSGGGGGGGGAADK